MKKNILREHSKNIRAKADMKSVSKKIVARIKDMKEFQQAKNVMIYYPHGSEIDLLGLLEDDSKKWLLPKVNGKELDVYFYKNGDALETNKWNIPEPLKSALKAEKSDLDMVLLPGLCADRKGFRLGYGFGFFDRFVRDLPRKCVKLLPLLDELFVDEIPKDQWDEPVDIIITEENRY